MLRYVKILLVLAVFQSHFAIAGEVKMIDGEIRECVRRYSPGFGGSNVIEGYCIGRIQFVESRKYYPEFDSDKASLLSIAQENLGQYAVIEFEPREWSVGCDLIDQIAHPIECSIKQPLRVLGLKLNDQIIVFEGQQ